MAISITECSTPSSAITPIRFSLRIMSIIRYSRLLLIGALFSVFMFFAFVTQRWDIMSNYPNLFIYFCGTLSIIIFAYMESIQIGEKIKFYREKKEITQTQLAEQLNLAGKNTISKYERGIRYPSMDVLNKICEALDISFEIVFKPLPRPKKK